MIEVIKQGKISATRVPSTYELSRQFVYDNPQFHIYEPNEGLMIFQNTKISDVNMDAVNIPIVRNISATGNLYYMANGMIMFDLQMNGSVIIAEAWTNAKIQIFKEKYNVDLIQDIQTRNTTRLEIDENEPYGFREVIIGSEEYKKSDKLYFMHNGNKVKVSSPQYSYDDHAFWDYILFDENFNYNKFQDYQTQEANDEYNNRGGDQFAYGISAIIPNIDIDGTVNDIVNRFLSIIGETRQDRNLTQDEMDEFTRLNVVHTDNDWIINANRTYPAPYYRDETGGDNSQTLFSVVLNAKPNTNKIPFTLTYKNCIFIKQDDPNEMLMNSVIGTYAIYSKPNLRNNKYKTGKIAHLYKSIAVDTVGNKTWVEIDIPLRADGTLLTGRGEYIIPQEFLNNAVYPITIT